MTLRVPPSDLELAALISSKICHDVINPVGAINNGLEILDEDRDGDSQKYALEMIRNVTAQASALLQFARFAFGAAGSAGAAIDLAMAQQVATGFVGSPEMKSKHKLVWRGPGGYMGKDKVKLLLNMIAIAMTALPRGGEIEAAIEGTMEQPVFTLRCKGQSARPPQYLAEFVAGNEPPLDSMSIQSYYTWRLAQGCKMALTVVKAEPDVLMIARTAA
jgi:histidine phosphotransferase ChpT